MVPIAITGPTGGVGSSAIDLFKRAGFTVHAITGKAGKADDYLKSLGADQVVSRQSLSVGSKPLERSEEHTSELQSLMRISYAVFCLKKKKKQNNKHDRPMRSHHKRSTPTNIHSHPLMRLNE